jgi:hypothetical protein
VERIKILIPYKIENEYFYESLWTISLGNDLYKLDNIPFFAKNISCDDICSVEIVDGVYYFNDLIEESQNSTVRLIINNDISKNDIGILFENIKCEWEGLKDRNYIAINVPSNVNYETVNLLLLDGVKNNFWDYEESCLSEIHRKQYEIK